MSEEMERDAAIISAVLDHLRAERDAARTELAELKAREHVLQPALKAALNNAHDEITRLRKELAELRTGNDTPALAGDALRDALTEAVAAALLRTPVAMEPDVTARVVAAIMPIVGRAALAAREAFPAPPFTMTHTFGYTCRCCDRVVAQSDGWVNHDAPCPRCLHTYADHRPPAPYNEDVSDQ